MISLTTQIEPHCDTCSEFHLHYVWLEYKQQFEPSPWGHCAIPHTRVRKSKADACARYRPKELAE